MNENDLPDDVTDSVRKKARRFSRSRRRRQSFWRDLGHVGALGWTFVLPVIAAAVLARIAVRGSDRPFLGLAVLLLGVLAGAYAVARQMKRSLDEAEREEREDEP